MIRLLHDFDLAEDAMHDAIRAAVEQWPHEDIPTNQRVWLVSAGRFKAIDTLRWRFCFEKQREELARQIDDETNDFADQDDKELEDDWHPKVMEACVVGIPNVGRGEVVKAYVSLKPGEEATVGELRTFCKEYLTHYKVPKYVEFRTELHKSQIGKVLRRILVEEEVAKQKTKQERVAARLQSRDAQTKEKMN